MRDFTKSMFSLSWALSLLGLQQTLNLMRPSKAAEAFDNVTQAGKEEMGDMLKEVFRAGDNLQRGLVDLTLDVLTGQVFNPSRRINIGSGVMRQSNETVRQGIKRMASGISQQSAEIVSQRAQGAPDDSQRAASGWGSVPRSGPATAPSQSQMAETQGVAEPGISPDYPYKPNYIEVFGSKMHYIDEGSGEVILFLHGNPTWSYLWRNIVPQLTPLGRCIAPDLIGYGMSEKPDIQYRWFDHARYLDEFIKRMGLRDFTLVLHDHGVALGIDYALGHENDVRALVFFEGMVKPIASWSQFSKPEFRETIRKFRTGGVGGEGWNLIVDQNAFIERLLPAAAGRSLSEKEMNYYREPFKDPTSRRPIWEFVHDTPIEGEPKDVHDRVFGNSERLKQSELPKLLFYGSPGAVLTQPVVDWCYQNLKNLKAVGVGPGAHFLQETSPRLIGTEIARWHNSLPSVQRR